MPARPNLIPFPASRARRPVEEPASVQAPVSPGERLRLPGESWWRTWWPWGAMAALLAGACALAWWEMGQPFGVGR